MILTVLETEDNRKGVKERREGATEEIREQEDEQ